MSRTHVTLLAEIYDCKYLTWAHRAWLFFRENVLSQPHLYNYKHGPRPGMKLKRTPI